MGHKVSNIKSFSNPTKIIDKKITTCICCGREILNNEEKYIPKQLVDIEIKLNITEKRVYEGYCSKCGMKHKGEFSTEHVNPVQYGNTIKAFSTLLNNYAFVPFNKTKDILCSITDGMLNISQGTI